MAELTVADASVLIALLDPGDAHHGAARDQFTAIEHFHVHPVTLAEVLVHPARIGKGDTVLSTLVALGMIIANPAIDPLGLAELRIESGLKMPDCLVLATARTLQATVMTFDERLLVASR